MLNNEKKPTVLIVDDVAENIDVLDEILNKEYKIKASVNGGNAIQIASQENPPDLILLDIVMPGLNGFDVMEVLKEGEKTRLIPVIFISALDAVSDKVKGLSLGGVDYITKPFQPEEVRARVRLHMTMQRLQSSLRKKNSQLQQAYDDLERRSSDLSRALQELEMTQQELIRSEKMAALGQLVAGVAHEINTPVGIGFTESSYLLRRTTEIHKLFAAGELRKSEFEAFLHATRESSEAIHVNLKRAANLIMSFKQVAVDQTYEEKREFNLAHYINEVLTGLKPKCDRRHIRINIDCPDEIGVLSYPGAFGQIITNLIENSLLHGFDGLDKGNIYIAVNEEEDSLQIQYRDDGLGMSAEQLHKVFDPFYTTKRARGGTGLGMNIVYNLIDRKLKGQIGCESEPGSGVVFTIRIPREIE
jgi:signal transduction histidine kinase